jgi:hypothetical protein
VALVTAASLGPHIGHAYVAGLGKGEVFASEKKDFFSFQVNRTSIRYWVNRDRVQFRSN